jgi:hypothetical protein
MFSTDIVDIERDDDEQFVQMTITRVNHTGKRTIDDEILLEYPEELSSIPGIDVAKLCWHLFESDDPWINVLTYGDGEGFQAPVTYTTTNQMGNYTEVTYQRDSNGLVIDIQREESIHFAPVEDNDPYTVELSDFDSKGNWLLCTKKWGDYTFIIKRTITYYQQN